jgi:ASPIC and UnbV/FG-GAP-like repeat
VAFEYGLGARFGDYDVDGDLDLYVANDTRPNRLYSNVAWPGGTAADPSGLGFRFEEMAGRAGVADPNAGMGVASGDFSDDARPDLFVTNARGQVHAAYRSEEGEQPGPAFVDVRQELGADLTGSTGWGVTFADLDLDTDLDLLYVNGAVPVTDLEGDAEPIRVLLGDGAASFEQVEVDDAGPLVARGSAVADFDNDGDLDVAVNVVGGRLVLLENRLGGGHWLTVDLGAGAHGARVTVTLEDGRAMVREAAAGSSYLSSEDPRLHFGLGDAEVEAVDVRWPDGEEVHLGDVDVDQIVEVRRR